MRLLIAIKSCQNDKNRGLHDAIRDTWGRHVPSGVELNFFMGAGSHAAHVDEVTIDSPDDYQSLPYKTKAILTWMLAKDYDFCFLADTDTYVIPSRLMQVGFENYDAYGINSLPLGITFSYHAPDRLGNNPFLPYCWPWFSGGLGYFVSRKAAEYVVAANPNIWAEDLWVGQVLGPLFRDGKIRMGNMQYNFASFHHPHNTEDVAAWMYRMYREHR